MAFSLINEIIISKLHLYLLSYRSVILKCIWWSESFKCDKYAKNKIKTSRGKNLITALSIVFKMCVLNCNAIYKYNKNDSVKSHTKIVVKIILAPLGLSAASALNQFGAKHPSRGRWGRCSGHLLKNWLFWCCKASEYSLDCSIKITAHHNHNHHNKCSTWSSSQSWCDVPPRGAAGPGHLNTSVHLMCPHQSDREMEDFSVLIQQ